MENKYCNFKKISETETELYIYGDIRKPDFIDAWFGLNTDDLTDSYTLKDALQIVDTPNLTVRINSYGGDVSEGLAIYSLLSEFKGHLKTIVDGFACSAASVIFMAGEERVVPENGLLMIHNAWTEARGDSNVMEKVAEDLRKITQPSLNIYVKKTNLSEEEIKQKMDREEWITSQEAYEWGFSTTQERKNGYMQALEASFVHDLVMKNKELQKQIRNLEENSNIVQLETVVKKVTKEIFDEQMKELDEKILKGSSNKKPTGLLNSQTQKPINKGSWESFFNTKN